MKPVNDHPIGRRIVSVSEGSLGRLRKPSDDQLDSDTAYLNSRSEISSLLLAPQIPPGTRWRFQGRLEVVDRLSPQNQVLEKLCFIRPCGPPAACLAMFVSRSYGSLPKNTTRYKNSPRPSSALVAWMKAAVSALRTSST